MGAPAAGLAVPGVLGIHHVAFAVADLDAALEYWLGTFGGELELRDVVASQGVEAATIEYERGAPFGALVELIAPAPGNAGSGSGVARFLERRGEGMHHVAWGVADVAHALTTLGQRGVRLIDTVPRTGLHGTDVAFVHPGSSGGVLVELVAVDASGS